MTHKQQAQFKAMAQMIQGLVQQVTLLTADLTVLADRLAAIENHPAVSIPPIQSRAT